VSSARRRRGLCECGKEEREKKRVLSKLWTRKKKEGFGSAQTFLKRAPVGLLGLKACWSQPLQKEKKRGRGLP